MVYKIELALHEAPVVVVVDFLVVVINIIVVVVVSVVVEIINELSKSS